MNQTAPNKSSWHLPCGKTQRQIHRFRMNFKGQSSRGSGSGANLSRFVDLPLDERLGYSAAMRPGPRFAGRAIQMTPISATNIQVEAQAMSFVART